MLPSPLSSVAPLLMLPSPLPSVAPPSVLSPPHDLSLPNFSLKSHADPKPQGPHQSGSAEGEVPVACGHAIDSAKGDASTSVHTTRQEAPFRTTPPSHCQSAPAGASHCAGGPSQPQAAFRPLTWDCITRTGSCARAAPAAAAALR